MSAVLFLAEVSFYLLSSVPELVHPSPNAPISLAIDTSYTHLGAVLQKLLNDSWALLAFYSKKLFDAEKKYSAFDRELLAAYSSLCHFRFMLEGRDFTIFTNHKPLTHALFRVSLPWSARQQHHFSYLAKFTSSVVHVPGPENVVADTLSRPSPNLSPYASNGSTVHSRQPYILNWLALTGSSICHCFFWV